MARLLSLVLALSAGCSFALGGPAPDRPRGKPPQCDTGKGLVVIDGLFASAMGLTAISLASSNNSSEHDAAIAPLILGAIYAGAALRGNSVVNDCRVAQDEFVAENGAPLPVAPPPRPRMVRSEPAVAIEPKPEPEPEPAPEPAPKPEPKRAPRPEPKPEPKPEASPWSEFWKEMP